MATIVTPSRNNVKSFFRRVAKAFGYEVIFGDSVRHVHLEKEGLPIIIGCDRVGTKTFYVSLYIRTTSWDFDGERTDLHDSLSILFCCILRMFAGGVSCRLWDVGHPAILAPKTEVYARYVTIEQPVGLLFGFDADGYKGISRIFQGLQMCELLLPRMLAHDHNESDLTKLPSYDFQGQYISRWSKAVATALNHKHDSKHTQYNQRHNPCWLYYRSLRPAISVLYNPRLAIGLRAFFDIGAKKEWKTLQGRSGLMLLSGETKNYVSFATTRRAIKILHALRENIEPNELRLIPLENYCVAVGVAHVLFINTDCGRNPFERERENLRDRHQQESVLLFPPSRITWKANIKDADFESLIHELLLCEPGVQWVRQIGHTNEPDGGRDFIAEWDTRPVPGQVLQDKQPPIVRRRVIIQCKALKRAVGKADVRDIYDLLKQHDASGFFFATSSHTTRGLIGYLEKLRYKDGYWSDWWTRAEVEMRLIKNENIALKYQSIVTIQR